MGEKLVNVSPVIEFRVLHLYYKVYVRQNYIKCIDNLPLSFPYFAFYPYFYLNIRIESNDSV